MLSLCSLCLKIDLGEGMGGGSGILFSAFAELLNYVITLFVFACVIVDGNGGGSGNRCSSTCSLFTDRFVCTPLAVDGSFLGIFS